ncbi:MAG: hypothetical protein ABW200_11490 [Hyphomicrobiaceae bacterium]
MDDTGIQRAQAGLSLLFAPGQRPDLNTLRGALQTCQVQATIVHEDADRGGAELIVSGLMFEVDGLAPGVAETAQVPADVYGFVDTLPTDRQGAVRLLPGHHLSGGLSLGPVIRAMLALAAELAVSLPVTAVLWHPAKTAIEPRAFSRAVLAWLAGGAFPAAGLTALSAMADGSVVSRGLAHFVGQEMTLRGEGGGPDFKLAAQIVDRIVQEGPLHALTQWRVHDVLVTAEPAHAARQILVWRAA